MKYLPVQIEWADCHLNISLVPSRKDVWLRLRECWCISTSTAQEMTAFDHILTLVLLSANCVNYLAIESIYDSVLYFFVQSRFSLTFERQIIRIHWKTFWRIFHLFGCASHPHKELQGVKRYSIYFICHFLGGTDHQSHGREDRQRKEALCKPPPHSWSASWSITAKPSLQSGSPEAITDKLERNHYVWRNYV